MIGTRRILGRLALLTAVLVGWAGPVAAQDPLPSWNAGATKRAILADVKEATTPGRPGFVPVAERIAVFDNDGTLWVEQPFYTQLAFALDRVKALAPQHPEWKTQEPFASLLKGDLAGAMAGGSTPFSRSSWPPTPG